MSSFIFDRCWHPIRYIYACHRLAHHRRVAATQQQHLIVYFGCLPLPYVLTHTLLTANGKHSGRNVMSIVYGGPQGPNHDLQESNNVCPDTRDKDLTTRLRTNVVSEREVVVVFDEGE